MILTIDYRGDRARFGWVGVKSTRWISMASKPGSSRPLAKAFNVFNLNKRAPQTVVVCLHDKELGAAHVSWSTVRAAVSTGNALGFAWGVPVVAVPVSGQEPPAELAALARVAARSGKLGEWIKPLYDGMPNISVAKKS